MITQTISSETEAAAEMLRRGGLVAVPTETVYGLAGNGLDEAVIEKIYKVKGRPAVKPISLMVSGSDQMDALCREVPPAALTLSGRFWPGPLTLVLRAKECVPSILRAGGETVGLRCPRQEQTLALLRSLEFPLAVPSANPSGKESPVTAEEVHAYFDGKIDAVIDGGPCSLGQESTVMDLSSEPYRILRQGSLPAEEIADALVDAMTLIGITGGTGSGKTTALDVLREEGAMILDADRIYHEQLECSSNMICELDAAFPTAVQNGRLDRQILREIVFRDESALQKLNGITHRYVADEIRNRLRTFAMEGGRLAAVDAIGLFESGLAERCDLTMAVTAPENTRVRRIMKRDGLTEDEALLRIRAQRPDSWYIQHCDAVLVNDGDLEKMYQQMKHIIEYSEKGGVQHG